eukprot:gene7182-11494_t
MSSKIVYAAVFQNKKIICDYTENSGNFRSITKQIIENLPKETEKVSYIYDESYTFHISIEKSTGFICLSESKFENNLAFAFLNSIRDIFAKNPDEFDDSILASKISHYSKNEKIFQIKNQVEETKDIMIENIEKVIERGEKLEILVEKSEDLSESAVVFNQTARNVKWLMLRRNMYLIIILIIIIISILLFLLWFVCGFPVFQNCLPSNK